MSKQFHLYLLPTDVDSLLETLRTQLGILLIQSWSSSLTPVLLESAMCKGGTELKTATVRADCYLSPKGAEIKMKFIRNRSLWIIDTDSEVIEFRGCELDGKVLVRGRFYFQTNVLMDGLIVPKRKDFLIWADKVFRLAKKSLVRSKALDAYVGESAEKWRRKGGRFAWAANNVRGPIYEAEA